MRRTSSIARPDRSRTEAPSLPGRRFWLALAAVCILLVSVPSGSQPEPAIPPTQVRGEVVMLTGELIVVRSADGTSILIPLGKDEVVETSIKVGDQVEVVVTSDHQVRLIKKVASNHS